MSASSGDRHHWREDQKRIIDYLNRHRGPMTAHHLKGPCNVDLDAKENEELLRNLKSNEKVEYEDKGTYATYTYKPSYKKIFYGTINNRDDICKVFTNNSNGNPKGVLLDDLEDAYPGVKDDISDLLASGVLMKVTNFEAKQWQDVLHYRMPMGEVSDRRTGEVEEESKVDDEFRTLWHEIALPPRADMNKALCALGFMTEEQLYDGSQNGTQLGRAAQLARKTKQAATGSAGQRKKRRGKLTNTHMIGQLEWLKK